MEMIEWTVFRTANKKDGIIVLDVQFCHSLGALNLPLRGLQGTLPPKRRRAVQGKDKLGGKVGPKISIIIKKRWI